MSRIIASHVSKSRFAKPVLVDVSFTLTDGQMIALTGENGSGKTTLLDLIAGVLPLDPEEGTIQIAQGSTIGYVRQRFDLTAEDAFFDEDLFLLEKRLRALEAKMADGDHSKKTLAAYDQAMSEVDALDAYGIRHRLEEAYRGFGLDETIFSRSLSTLSGGERMRIELASCLVRRPDILLLDEPTNHLDLAGMRYLENWLKKYSGCCLFVSHDRTFMDQVATDVMRLSGGSIDIVRGNYSHFLDVQAMREADLSVQISTQEKLLKREREITQTMLSHRKISQYHHRKRRAEKMAGELSRLKAAARKKDRTLGLRFATTPDDSDLDRVVLSLDHLSGGYDSPLFSGLTARIKANERIAILGPNGCGKSTLLSILSGNMAPLAGSYRFAAGIKKGSLAQHIRFDQAYATIDSEVRRFTGDDSETGIRTRLAQYGFDDTDRHKKLNVLSGGEAARVALLKLLYEKPSFLLLDEPTNHLDIYTREMLQHELARYPGTLLFISHDRHFLRHVATSIWGFVGKNILPFKRYEDWLAACDQELKRLDEEDSEQAAPTKDMNRAEKRREAALRRRTISDLEAKITSLEATIAEIEKSLDENSGPEIYEEYAKLMASLDQMTDRYLNLLVD